MGWEMFDLEPRRGASTTKGLRALLLSVLSLLVLAGCATPELPALATDGQRLPGKFVWFDLATSDVERSERFYAAVFGWQFRRAGRSSDRYTVIRHAGRDIGGMFRSPGEGTRTARWLPLISVSDARVASTGVEQNGGRVVVAPTHVARRGTHALLRDAEGALFGVLQTDTGDPADTPVPIGDFFWVDLFARSPAQAAAFYRSIAGYEVSSERLGVGVERVVLSAGGFARAGVAPLPATLNDSGWLPYVLVRDVAATLERVRRAGGRLLAAPRAEWLEGRIAVFADPGGGVLGIVDWRAEPGAGGSR